jgi:hypothetical protein
MSFRPGSIIAKKLFNSAIINNKDIIKEYNYYLSLYNEAVLCVFTKRKKLDVINLDNFYRFELPILVKSRKFEHIILDELCKIMEWKIIRGKFRPLLKLVSSNININVIKASTSSFKYAKNGNITLAINELSTLKGIGPATASAILSSIYPDLFPFMADEVIESTNQTRDYTINTYLIIQDLVLLKSNELTKETNDKELLQIWTPEDVGKALWTVAMISIHKPDLLYNEMDTGSDIEIEKKRNIIINNNNISKKRNSRSIDNIIINNNNNNNKDIIEKKIKT